MDINERFEKAVNEAMRLRGCGYEMALAIHTAATGYEVDKKELAREMQKRGNAVKKARRKMVARSTISKPKVSEAWKNSDDKRYGWIHD